MANVAHAVQTKSDQLNADDLLIGDITAKILRVTVNNSDQPVHVHLEGFDGKPWKPCKSMLRVLSAVWSPESDNWVGHSVSLYNDTSVKWAGKEYGGIRVRAMSGLTQDFNMMLTVTRGKKSQYTVNPLIQELKPYSNESLNANKNKWLEMFANNKTTPDKLISQIQQMYTLTKEQISTIKGLNKDAS